MTEHLPVDVTPKHDAEGMRTHAPPAHVCSACSDFEQGLLVPVSFCPAALAALEAEEADIRGQGYSYPYDVPAAPREGS